MRRASDWQTLKPRVASVFAALREHGINARGPVGFDQTEAIAKVAPSAERGFAYYHSQDSHRARGGGPLFIGFGGAHKTDRNAAAIGREVADALEREGLHVAWDGTAKSRLAVHLSRDAAERAARAEKVTAEAEGLKQKELRQSRRDPEAFFAGLRSALAALAATDRFHVVYGRRVEYMERGALVGQVHKTVVVCPTEMSTTWDRHQLDVLTYPTEHDKDVVKEIAEGLRRAGYKVALVHGSYLHVRTTA